MNNGKRISLQQVDAGKERRKYSIDGKIKDLLIVGGLALALVFASWKIFYTNEEKPTKADVVSGTQSEERVKRLLEEIDGVGEAEVMVCETEEGVQSVVVVCEGATNFQVVIHVRQAVAAALGTNEKAVKIYQKKG